MARVNEKRNVCRILVGNLKERYNLGRYRWERNVEMNLKEIGRECVDWIRLAQGSDMLRVVVKTVMNELSVSIKYGEFPD
jgi:hypothetical protein